MWVKSQPAWGELRQIRERARIWAEPLGKRGREGPGGRDVTTEDEAGLKEEVEMYQVWVLEGTCSLKIMRKTSVSEGLSLFPQRGREGVSQGSETAEKQNQQDIYRCGRGDLLWELWEVPRYTASWRTRRASGFTLSLRPSSRGEEGEVLLA